MAAVTLHADWAPADQHRVRFWMNYGDNELHATVMVDEGRTVRPPMNPTRAGYLFRGWYTTPAATAADRFNFGTVITGSRELYARWTLIDDSVHTVLFWLNDNSGNLHYADFIEDGYRATAPADPTRAGYLFVGWHEHPQNRTLFNFNTPITAELNLYAHWHCDNDPYYAVVFRMNDGTPAIHYVAFVEPGNTVHPPVNPLRDGLTFRNWYTSTAATLATRFNFGTIIDGNRQLYAGWDNDGEYTVHTVLFYRNDGTARLHYAAFVRDGEIVTAPANPVWADHTFLGWHRNPTGSSLYDFSTPVMGGLSLHAYWHDGAGPQHLIRFWMNDGTGDNGRGALFAYREVTNGRTVTPPLPNPTRESVLRLMEPRFALPTVTDDEDEYYEEDDAIVEEDVIVDGDGDITDDDYADEDETIEDDNAVTDDEAIDDASTEDESEYATAPSDDDTNEITLGSDDLTELLGQILIVQYNETTVIYTFSGWYTCQTGAPSTRFNFGTPITEPVDLYARWERYTPAIDITHTVLFQRNDGSQNLHYAAFVPDGELLSAYAHRLTNPTRTGYTFTGWFEDAQGTIPFTNFEVIVENSFSLYAGWAIIIDTHTVAFHRNYTGAAAPQTVTVERGQTVSAPAAPTREGFTFQGWYINAEGTQAFNFNTAITSDLSLFARWEAIAVTHTVTFYRNDNSNAVHHTATVQQGQTVSVPAVPVRHGFTFQGWYINAEGTQAFNFNTAITGNLSLFARWTLIPSVGGGGGGGTPQPPTVILPEPEPPLAPFTEYHNAFLIGFPDGTIRPQATLTRAEVVTMLFRLLEDNFRARVWSQSNRFTDVNEGQWFNNAISTMANAGILDRDEEFRPNDAVTRAEFASMVARFFDDVEAIETPFNDIDGHWAEDYINRIAQFNWVQGVGNGNFNPDAQMTRAEATAIINRMLERIVGSPGDLLSGRTRWPDMTNTNAWYYLYMQEATHSTEFERLPSGTVRWTDILTNIDWTVLERPHSVPGSIIVERAIQQSVN